jgi:hypothetical protein
MLEWRHSMKEEIIHLSEHLKGLTDGERTILWQALTVDILGRMMSSDTDELVLFFGLGDNEHYYAHVARPDESGDTASVLMSWHGERVKKS